MLAEFDIQFKIEEIRSPSRLSELVFIRALIVVYLKRRGLTYEDIGIIINRKSHATVINLMKYKTKKQARDFRWDYISNKLMDGITNFEIKDKIKWHQIQIIKLQKALV